MNEILKKKNGANFYKVDLHLHTPADFQFQRVENVNSNEKRKAFVKKYLNIVLQKELGIIAITDHNNISWLLFFQELNQAEPFKHIIIFPGLEISSREGIHLLVLFEPGYPVVNIQNFLVKVGLENPFDGKRGI